MIRPSPSIVVDARLIASSGIGTYLRNTLSRIIQARPTWHFTLLGDRERLADVVSSDNSEIRVADSPVYSLREQLTFARLDLRRADLFWAPHYNVPLAPTRRLVVTVHDVMHLTLPEYRNHWLRRQYATTMYTVVRRRGSAVICVSDFTRRELERVVGAGPATHVVHNGVHPSWFDVSRRADTSAPARPYIVFVGLAKPHKNLVGLLQAFAMIRERVSHDLVIVGSQRGALRTSDRRIDAAAAALNGRVRFAEHLELSSLQQCVAGAEVLVQPSLCEGFGLPPLEAMAAGTPCLASRIEPLVEVCGDAAAYCDPRDPADIARRLLELLENRQARQELSSRGRERARAFSWDRSATETLAVFEQVLSS
ncbi:MAG TPA: glycosyltransferase family 1 protein [Gemmatimonadaceae bacterium]|jgi:glycosyltransferase involved in cell wall biosynthesis|nr:glycosyltransferase family 1 protein [Gemmatimonadaceae bacterium]